MKKSHLAKKCAIGLSIGWLAFVVLSYIPIMFITVFYPEYYLKFLNDGVSIFIAMLAISVLSIIWMLAIFCFSKKAGIAWLKIVALIHMGVDILFFTLASIQLLLVV